mmetsp:Transcript_25221/g.39023  ORF Transcript_25221/g.39023 Transcript_25221/m.39023 type:complete len:433 (+) Transcript_25221:58-1356(+)
MNNKRKQSSSLSPLSPSDKICKHADAGAAAADHFYSNLNRTNQELRTNSRLFHMRAFNGWVKAMQIAQVQTALRRKEGDGLRILDLGCGKGGDLGKWCNQQTTRNPVQWYVGIDAAKGSLQDAAKRIINLPPGRRRMQRAHLVWADLGADVPGGDQKLETWIMENSVSATSSNSTVVRETVPQFRKVAGGGISSTDRFDVVSIQLAIHYMMSSEERARRFFKTVGSLLDVGGMLIATTIDARVIISHLMDHLGTNIESNNGDVNDDDEELHSCEDLLTLSVGGGACKLKFKREMLHRIFNLRKSSDANYVESCSDNTFGLEYTFTLSEGNDHEAGVGEAVDLPEWLTPIPVLQSLANDVGLRLNTHENFHEFYRNRSKLPQAQNALYNMHVLDRTGSISKEEWEICRMYTAVSFTKIREVTMSKVSGMMQRN